MTLGPIHPEGVATKDRITGERMTHLDTQMTYAIDGAAGGTYAVTNPIRLGGKLQMNGAGGVVSWRYTSVTSTTTDQSITVGSDFWLSAVSSSTSRDWNLRDTSARKGSRVVLTRDGGSDTGTITVRRESDNVVMLRFPSGADCWAEFEHDGDDWRTLGWSSTIAGGGVPTTI